MVKSNYDDKVPPKTLLERVGKAGMSKIYGYIAALVVGAVLFASCFNNQNNTFSGNADRNSVVVFRQVLTKITEAGFDQATVKEYLQLAKKTFPRLYSFRVFVRQNIEVSLGKDDKPFGQESTLLKQESLASIHKTGSIVPFTVFLGGARMQGFFMPLFNMGERYFTASVVFHEPHTMSVILPYLGVLLVIILVMVGVAFFYTLQRGADFLEFTLRYFVFGAVLLFLISGYVLMLIQGGEFQGRNTVFADKSAALLVQKGMLSADGYSYKELVKKFNLSLDNQQNQRFSVNAEGQKPVIRDAEAFRGDLGTLVLIFLVLGAILTVPLCFGAYTIVDKGLEGVKTFISYSLIVLFVVVCMIPVIWIIVASFFSKLEVTSMINLIQRGDFFTRNYFTLENYKEIVAGQSMFWVYFRNSLFVSGVTAIICGFFGVMAGYAFSRFVFPGRKKQLMWILLSQLFPMAMMILPLYIVAQILNLEKSLWIIVIAYSATALPFSIWMMKGYFDTIPVDIEEAAAIDGASTLGRLWHVLLPLARPAIATTVFYSFITAWNEFAIASFFLNLDELRTLPVALTSLLDPRNPQYAIFSAACVLASFPVVLLFIYLQKHLVSGLTAGGVKG